MLHEIVTTNIFAFLLIFMRLGVALMVMPGIGDSFVTPQVRLLFALSMSFILTPVLAMNLPAVPVQSLPFFSLLITEAFVGMFIGTVMRIMISALDTAGMIVSIQAGFSNAMIFNPLTGTQGSILGSVYSMTGVVLLFVSNLHHYMLASVVDSYTLFPATGHLPDMEGLSQAITLIVSLAFKVGVQMAIPFIVVGLIVQIGFGLLGKLMPQVQIFFLAMPAQILLSLVMITMALSTGILFWLNSFETIVTNAVAPLK